ncbi:MAG TPA: FAD:protein FMN transferase, partial [Candidatus Paceibacterota bacterium]|nr:FAD:protein FMN transferase [Candidatus Paceibacterota bacterium]
RIDIFDKTYSRFRTDSLVAEISEKVGAYIFPDDVEKLFSIYRKMFVLTDGLMTPLVGNLISDLGYDRMYSLKPKEKINQPKVWDEVMSYVHPQLTTKEPVLLDFGAAGKGYLIDIVAEIIDEADIKNFLINAGGDIRCESATEEKFTIGLENPKDFKQIIGTVSIAKGSICGSSGNRRRWDKYHHIINPKTLSSPENILALWVVADTTILADALSTALFFIEPEIAQKEFTFEYLILYPDFSIKVSDDFPGEFFKS